MTSRHDAHQFRRRGFHRFPTGQLLLQFSFQTPFSPRLHDLAPDVESFHPAMREEVLIPIAAEDQFCLCLYLGGFTADVDDVGTGPGFSVGMLDCDKVLEGEFNGVFPCRKPGISRPELEGNGCN